LSDEIYSVKFLIRPPDRYVVAELFYESVASVAEQRTAFKCMPQVQSLVKLHWPTSAPSPNFTGGAKSAKFGLIFDITRQRQKCSK